MTERPTTEPDPERLAALEKRLNEVKRAKMSASQGGDYSKADMAWRMVIEMVSGLGIGFGIGYGLDTIFGTLPWLMVLFTMLGLAAGVKVMIRSAQDMQKQAAEQPFDEEGR